MLQKIPTKWLLFFLIIGVAIIGFAVVVQDKHLDLWGVKIGQSNAQLRQELLQARKDLAFTVPIEKFQEAQTQLKEEASKNLQLTDELDRLKKEIQQAKAESKAAKGASVEARRLRARIKQLTAELKEATLVLEATKGELTSSIGQSRKLAIELNKLKDAQVSISKNKLRAFFQQLAELEVKAFSVGPNNKAGFVTAFNSIVKSLKAELRQDSYVQTLSGINSKATFIEIAPYLRDQSSQIRKYLKETYLK